MPSAASRLPVSDGRVSLSACTLTSSTRTAPLHSTILRPRPLRLRPPSGGQSTLEADKYQQRHASPSNARLQRQNAAYTQPDRTWIYQASPTRKVLRSILLTPWQNLCQSAICRRESGCPRSAVKHATKFSTHAGAAFSASPPLIPETCPFALGIRLLLATMSIFDSLASKAKVNRHRTFC